uniref:Uncharacterized protein n=1 Tax=Rhizophora mucronata TaxID=61149 RepID=A0A2P2PU26_RHIMU
MQPKKTGWLQSKLPKELGNKYHEHPFQTKNINEKIIIIINLCKYIFFECIMQANLETTIFFNEAHILQSPT